jgi:creatinine amidohydrolase
MQLGENTWQGARALAAEGVPVVVPIASFEQHGHHLPMLTDTLIGAEVARRVETALGPDEAVFTPTLWLGASDHHLTFGAISLSIETYTRVLIELVESLITLGFTRIFLLNSHGGNIVPGQAALTELMIRHRERPELYLVFATWFDFVAQSAARLPAEFVQRKVIHACEWETSQILNIRPDLVGETRPAARYDFDSQFWQPDHFGTNRVFVARTMEMGSKTGAFGHPELATPEKGEALFALAASEIVAFVRELKAWPVAHLFLPLPNPSPGRSFVAGKGASGKCTWQAFHLQAPPLPRRNDWPGEGGYPLAGGGRGQSLSQASRYFRPLPVLNRTMRSSGSI